MAWPLSPMYSPVTNGNFSTHMSLRPDPTQNDERARSLLTSYEVHTLTPAPINNIVVRDGKKVKWENVTQRQIALPAENITARIAALNKKQDINSKFKKLKEHQQGHVANLLTSKSRGGLPSFRWTLSQLERQEQEVSPKLKETTILILYIKKAPIEGILPSALYRELHPHSCGPGQYPVQVLEAHVLEAPPPPIQHLNIHGGAVTHSHQNGSSSQSSGSKQQSGDSSGEKSHSSTTTSATGSSHSSKHSTKKHHHKHSEDDTITLPKTFLAELSRVLELSRVYPVLDHRLHSRERYIEEGREQMREKMREIMEAYDELGRISRRDPFRYR